MVESNEKFIYKLNSACFVKSIVMQFISSWDVGPTKLLNVLVMFLQVERVMENVLPMLTNPFGEEIEDMEKRKDEVDGKAEKIVCKEIWGGSRDSSRLTSRWLKNDWWRKEFWLGTIWRASKYFRDTFEALYIWGALSCDLGVCHLIFSMIYSTVWWWLSSYLHAYMQVTGMEWIMWLPPLFCKMGNET